MAEHLTITNPDDARHLRRAADLLNEAEMIAGIRLHLDQAGRVEVCPHLSTQAARESNAAACKAINKALPAILKPLVDAIMQEANEAMSKALSAGNHHE